MESENSRRRRPGPLGDLPDNLPPARAALAAELRLGRDGSGQSLAELARSAYSSKASVSRWLNGQSLPDEEQARRWARACGTGEDAMARFLAAAAATPYGADVPPATVTRDNGTSPGPELASSVPETGGPLAPPPVVSRLRRRLAVIGAAVLLPTAASFVGVSLAQRHQPAPAVVHHQYSAILQIPPTTGSHVHVTVEATRSFDPGRTYLVIEEVLDVDTNNPHPAYWVKAQIPSLKARQTSSRDFVIKEPITTVGDFFVASVNKSGLRILQEKYTAIYGALSLPPGTQLASPKIRHVKTRN